MLEAANARPRFTISLKRSTQNLQLSTSRRPITPSLVRFSDLMQTLVEVREVPISDIGHRDKGDSNFAFHGCSERRNLDKSMRSAFHSKVDLVTRRYKVDGFCQKCLGAILQCLAFRIRVPIGRYHDDGYVWS